MILFRALSRFRALFDGDRPSAQNRDTTVFKIYIQFIKFSKFISARLEARPGGKWHPVLLIVVIENGLLDLG